MDRGHYRVPGACAARLYAIAAPRLRRNGNRWLGKTVVRRDSPFAWGLRHQALCDRRSAAENRASAVTRFFKLRSSDRIKPGGASPRFAKRHTAITHPRFANPPFASTRLDSRIPMRNNASRHRKRHTRNHAPGDINTSSVMLTRTDRARNRTAGGETNRLGWRRGAAEIAAPVTLGHGRRF